MYPEHISIYFALTTGTAPIRSPRCNARCRYSDVTLLITLITLVLCTRRAGEAASRYSRCAAWFWVPFTLVLFAMQVRSVLLSTRGQAVAAGRSILLSYIFNLTWPPELWFLAVHAAGWTTQVNDEGCERFFRASILRGGLV